MAKKVEDKTAADKTEIGFQYQHYHSVLELLKMDIDDTLSVEEKDDLVISNSSGLRLIQLKHTLQKKKDNSSKNLTSKDYSLWHTIHNWIKLIQDEEDGRKDEKAQLQFIESSIFELSTNKSANNSNTFIVNLKRLKEGTIAIGKFNQALQKLMKNELDEEKTTPITSRYIEEFISFKHQETLLKKINLSLNQDNLIDRIKDYITVNLGFITNAEDVFFEIEGRIRTLNYLTIKNGKKIIYTKRDFSKKILGPVTQKIRSSKFHVITPTYTPNKAVQNTNFGKQLSDITIDLEDIIEGEYIMQLCLANIKKWEERDNIIFASDREAFFKDALKKWKSIHGINHRNTYSELHNSLNCYDECMLQTLILCNVPMQQEISNGAFINLSDELQIGWKKDWKTLYGK